MKSITLMAFFNTIKKNKFQSIIWITLGLLAFKPTFSAELGFAPSPCPTGGSGPRIVYLSEEIPGICNDASQVQDIIFQLGSTGTLIIDKSCELNHGLRLPARFTLKGTGIGSSGALSFNHDGIALSICQGEGRDYVTIADLDLYGPYRIETDDIVVEAPHSKGIALANVNIISLTNIRVSDFNTGVVGTNSYSVYINGSNISNNRGDNIRVGYASNGWRIRDSIVSMAGIWGIHVLGRGDEKPIDIGDRIPWDTSNDLLVDGLRMESNGKGGIRANADSSRIINTRFELNGNGTGILVGREANNTRILSNVFSSNCITNLGVNTEQSFNIISEFC